MRTMLYGAMLLGAAGMAGGCTDREATAPARRLDVPTDMSASREDDPGDQKQKVTGNAFFQIDYAGNPFQRYTVSAIRHRDGSFSGEFEETSEQDGGQRVKGTIYCFRIERDTVRFVGFVKRSNVPAFENGYVIWNVVDRGKKNDRTTDLFFGPKERAAPHCTVDVLRGQRYYDVLKGDFRIDE